MLVTADVIGLYSYIHHVTGLKAPKNPINNRKPDIFPRRNFENGRVCFEKRLFWI